MNNDFGISNSVDLYKRLTPALNCKKRELERLNIKNIKNEDIWNYILKTKWENVVGLDLSKMVDDILNLDNDDLTKFMTVKTDNPLNDNLVGQEIELL